MSSSASSPPAWPAVLLAVALVLPFLNGAAAADTQRTDLSGLDLSCHGCNIILLNIELLRADHVGLNSASSGQSNTPNIDRFFARSIVFEDVSAPAGESYRSNLSVQTAMQAFHYRASEMDIHGFIGRKNHDPYTDANKRIARMLTRYPAMAEYFQAAGFHSISMNQGIRGGRNLLLDRGFDEVVNWSRRTTPFSTTVDDVVTALKSRKAGPFLIHYRPEVLHPFPYYYPDTRQRITWPGRIYNFHRPRYDRYSIRVRPSLSRQEKREAHHRVYAQQVRYMDDELGAVFGAIRQQGLEENSIIVLYANHGSGLGDNGVDKLAVSYQSCIHVPLLIRHPRVSRTVRVSAPVPLIDLVPTLLDMAGLEPGAHFEGASLLRNVAEAGTHPYLAGRNDFDEYIREEALKLIVKHGELSELYNVKEDPHETRDLSYSLPAEMRVLKTALESIKLSVLRKDAAVDRLLSE